MSDTAYKALIRRAAFTKDQLTLLSNQIVMIHIKRLIITFIFSNDTMVEHIPFSEYNNINYYMNINI